MAAFYFRHRANIRSNQTVDPMNAMVKCHRRSFVFLLLLLGLSAVGFGQPKAAFSASPVSGCSPLVVYFFDSSTGNPSQWRWDLGNGVTSFLRNPSATYFSAGTYNVKLVVTNAAGKDSVLKTQYITVYASPKVDFGFNKLTGCFPLPVQFTEKATAGSGTAISWKWDFGDGTMSDKQSPVHTYTTAGNFSATLQVTNSYGCTKSFTQTQAINITQGVKADFANTDPGFCSAPANVQFTNNSTGPGPLSYQWNFGDGVNSNANSPTHVYTKNGNYSVSLIASSPQGCADTVTKTQVFKLGSAKAAFTAPSAACINTPVQFTSTSSPTPLAVKWDFDNTTYSTENNPVQTFTQPGTFMVRLVADFGGCSDTVKHPVSVLPLPSADFTAAQNSFCKLPVTVRFAAATKGYNYKYTWDFGDGSTGTGSDPVHTYTAEGSYTVRLVVTNPAGCSDGVTKKEFIQVYKPVITVEGLPKKGCSPLSISPTASVSGGATITNYFWDFGDSTTSIAANPSHTYSKKGTYNVRLIAKLASGCVDTVLLTAAVRVGGKPHADFVYTPATVCPYENVSFTDKSSGNPDYWFWDFGDGSTTSERNPIHQYGDTGWHDVKLIVFNNTCPDTTIIKSAVYVNPPIAIFDVVNDCNRKYTKKFADKSLGAKTWFWEFGDGNTSSEQNPVHTYAGTGTYSVKLTVTNNACTHFLTKTVLVIDEKADFSVQDTILCRNSSTTFEPIGINQNNLSIWYWDFDDGGISTYLRPGAHSFAATGTYNVKLMFTDLVGCGSSKSLAVRVFSPTAKFQPAVAAACLKENNIVFNDASFANPQRTIVKRIWNYDDDIIDSTASAPFAHHYTAPGSFNVRLTVVDNFGCRDSATTPTAIVIAQPVASFAVNDSLSCTGKAIAFNDASSAVNPQYQWSFGDGLTSTLANPVHAYSQTGFYSIKFLVTDQYGCTDSVVKPRWINITYPKAGFSLSDSFSTCPPLLVHFTNKATNYKNIQWDFGDGNTSALDTPSHFYSMPGTYYATLVATSYGGCTDTVRKKIVVKGPSGSFKYEPLSGCKPLTVAFTATTKGDASFIWDFSDGATETSKSKTTSHTYVDAGDFVPKIILKDSGGCVVPVVGEDTVRVKTVVTDFSLNSGTFCNTGLAQFNNQTASNDVITDYQWDFGDGTTGTDPNPAHHYTVPGHYTVQLQVTTESGCTDKKISVDTIKIYPAPIVQITGDSAACAPANFVYKGQIVRGNASLLNWSWNFGNSVTSTLQNPAPQAYTDGSYTVSVVATDEHYCSDTAFKSVTVFPLPKTAAGDDKWICRGSFQQLKATGAETYHWQAAASLSCTDCDGPLAAPTDYTQYIITGYNSFGCSKSDTVVIQVHQPFTLSVEKGDTICVGTPIRLAATGADQYTWTPALDVKDPSAGITSATPKVNTTYTVTAKDNYNCFTETGTVFIKVWPIPVVEIEDMKTLSVGNSMQLSPAYSTDVTSYRWSNAQTLSCATCPSPVANPKTETTYTIDVANDGGCTAKDQVTVHVICNDGNLFIPNTFSPNNDGRNEKFYPRGTGIKSIKSLKAYNRWGQLVFSRENFDANDAAAGWDGTLKGAVLTPDVYIYTCEVICLNNEVLTFKGDVTLLR